MRWMLGMFEAGLFPGVTYYLSWYVLRSRANNSFPDVGPTAGTSVLSSVSVPLYSSQLQLSQGHSVAFSLYVHITDDKGHSNFHV